MKEMYKEKANMLAKLLEKTQLKEKDILRNKSRDRAGFRDPMVVENHKLQEDVKGKIRFVHRVIAEIDSKLRIINKSIHQSSDENDSELPRNYESQLVMNTFAFAAINEEEDSEAT